MNNHNCAESVPVRVLSRLWPGTLLGQLMLTFTFGYLMLVVLSSLHASQTHQFYLLRSIMSDRARQMANATLLLDMTAPQARQQLLDRLIIRGMTIRLSDKPPALPAPKDNGKLHEANTLFLERLNAYLQETRQMESGDAPLSQTARAVVQAVDIPGFTDDMTATLRRYLGHSPRRDHSLYQAVVGLPLEDGSWVIVEDAPHIFRGKPHFPFVGIIVTEIFLILLSLVAFWIIVRPLRRLARAADSFGRDLPGTPPLPETGPREEREAAQAFNRMQSRIRDFVAERARTLAAVSHDLRTPLTRMRLRVEQLDDARRLPLQKDMDELQQLMDTSMDLARSSTEDCAPLDMAALLESLVEDRQDMGQKVSLADPDSLHGVIPLSARPLSIKRCLSNLLDNAVRYGGDAVMTVKDSPEELTILIRDHGPGIPEEALERVFQPFYRLEPSRCRSTGGNGLGLAIARNMIRLHGGDISLSNAPDGGLEVCVTLPRRETNQPLGRE